MLEAPTFRSVRLRVTLSDPDLVTLAKPLLDLRRQGFMCITATVDGYNDDPLPAQDIPEIRRLFQRLIDTGFIACFDFSAASTALRYRPPGEVVVGAGAYEVWLIATG